jgi:hypothetical protein
MSLKAKIGRFVRQRFGADTVLDFTGQLIAKHNIKVALDIGCGVSSPLTQFRPQVRTIGLDAHTVEVAKRNDVHDRYIVADVIGMSVAQIRELLWEAAQTDRVDLVTLYGVIEHFPKREGWALLERLEQLSSRFVLLETPNGFVPQGPEFGNPYQRHLSGWFPDDFRGLGYNVYGSLGTKYMRGYMAEPRLGFPGATLLDDLVLTRLFWCRRFPQHAFNITAIKDLNGPPARYTSHPNRT